MKHEYFRLGAEAVELSEAFSREQLVAELSAREQAGSDIPLNPELESYSSKNIRRAIQIQEWEKEDLSDNASVTVDPENRREVLKAKVQEIVKSFRNSPETIAEYLKFASKFSRYSHHNMRLIWAQNKDAQFVAPASCFYNGLPDAEGKRLTEEKILISKGERALYIWKPTKQKEVKIPDVGWSSVGKLSKKQRLQAQSESWETRESLKYILVPVFDIAQTNAPPEIYPKLMRFGQVSADADLKFEAIKNYAENELHYPVNIVDFGRQKTSLYGTYNHVKNVISVSDMLQGDERLAALIHELGHAEMHAAKGQVTGIPECQMELEAEMYVLMVQSYMGLEPTDGTKEYIGRQYGRYLDYLERQLPEGQALGINGDKEPFDNVLQKYQEKLPVMKEYMDRQDTIREQYSALEAGQPTATAIPKETPDYGRQHHFTL